MGWRAGVLLFALTVWSLHNMRCGHPQPRLAAMKAQTHINKGRGTIHLQMTGTKPGVLVLPWSEAAENHGRWLQPTGAAALFPSAASVCWTSGHTLVPVLVASVDFRLRLWEPQTLNHSIWGLSENRDRCRRSSGLRPGNWGSFK